MNSGFSARPRSPIFWRSGLGGLGLLALAGAGGRAEHLLAHLRQLGQLQGDMVVDGALGNLTFASGSPAAMPVSSSIASSMSWTARYGSDLP